MTNYLIVIMIMIIKIRIRMMIIAITTIVTWLTNVTNDIITSHKTRPLSFSLIKNMTRLKQPNNNDNNNNNRNNNNNNNNKNLFIVILSTSWDKFKQYQPLIPPNIGFNRKPSCFFICRMTFFFPYVAAITSCLASTLLAIVGIIFAREVAILPEFPYIWRYASKPSVKWTREFDSCECIKDMSPICLAIFVTFSWSALLTIWWFSFITRPSTNVKLRVPFIMIMMIKKDNNKWIWL